MALAHEPAHTLAGNGFDALDRRIQRIVQGPTTGEQRLVLTFGRLRLTQVGGVDPLDHVEEEQKAKLFHVGQRIGIPAAIEVVPDLIDFAAHLGCEWHSGPLIDRFAGLRRIITMGGIG
jgi:hypothetical protein